MSAFVEAVCLSPTHGFSKSPQLSIRLLAGEGVEGDAHRGASTQHLYLKRRNPSLPNLCQVHLLGAEMLEELAAKGYAIAAGQLGENILTRNLDLLALPRHTLLHVGDAAVLEVTGLRTPCSQIDAFRPGLQARLWGALGATGEKTRRAGVMSVVIQGGDVRPSASIRVELPALPHLSLGPV